jgi:hypothetical protein
MSAFGRVGIVSAAVMILALGLPGPVRAGSAIPQTVYLTAVPVNTMGVANVSITVDAGKQLGIATGTGTEAPFGVYFGSCLAFTGPGTCTLEELYTPSSEAIEYATTRVWQCQAGGGACDDFPIKFDVVASGAFVATAPNVYFGSVPVNTTSTMDVTVTIDKGYRFSEAYHPTDPLNPGPAGPFSSSDGSCFSFVGPGTCTFQEQFTPTTTDAVSESWEVAECEAGGGACHNVPFTVVGSGTFVGAVSPSSVHFGAVPLNTTATAYVTVTIDGGYRFGDAYDQANPFGSSAPFGFSAGTCHLFVGPGTCSFQELFTPTTPGPASQSWQVAECEVGNGPCRTIDFDVDGSGLVDTTPPVITPAIVGIPGANGWYTSDVFVGWTVTDQESAVSSQSGCTTVTVTSDTSGTDFTCTAVSAGGSSTLTVTVKRDATPPAIHVAQSPAANPAGWNKSDVTATFTCSDGGSGVATCPSPVTFAEGAAQGGTVAATDAAGNSSSLTFDGINVDETAPWLIGSATSAPNAAGWYSGDVTIHWTCNDGLSGIAGSCPADDLITSAGEGLTATESVTDKAGNTTLATSDPVKIDRTRPITTISAPSGWMNSGVTVTLAATDDLSGVAATYTSLDGGPAQSGDNVQITSEGVHSLAYWSVDNAGNVEVPRTVNVMIDATAPTVTYIGNLGSYGLLDSVAITCTAADNVGGSGLASNTCANASGPAWSFGAGSHSLSASATDHAGNTGTASANFTVSVSSAGLCTLTGQFVAGSTKYSTLTPVQRAVVNLLVRSGCSFLTTLGPNMKPAQKQAFINAYSEVVQALVRPGWLTQAQATTLRGLAGAL